ANQNSFLLLDPMNANAKSLDHVGRLIAKLASDDAAMRQESRNELVQLGGADVTRSLVLTLLDPQPHVRWEAAKALQTIADPVAAPALVLALDDDNDDVRWVAVDALVVLGDVGVLAVLNGLIKRAGSIAFCKSAHHVLHEAKSAATVVAPVLQALDQAEPAVAAPPAAYIALVELNRKLDAN
ncbi:MAG: HEAT repeat domain-containing protein, partial [Planctomycetales bacterium]|nr:HEAT repeat domain-containing protein [Planctomycetales bacterium]